MIELLGWFFLIYISIGAGLMVVNRDLIRREHLGMQFAAFLGFWPFMILMMFIDGLKVRL